MSNDDAKAIFLRYGGSHFHMDREGEYEYYKTFKISKEQERLWYDEYLQELLELIKHEQIISDSFVKFIFAISNSKSSYYFNELLELAKNKRDNSDTFTQIRMAESILNVVKNYRGDRYVGNVDLVTYGKHFALDILKNINQESITIDPYYWEQISLKDILRKENIISRVKMNLEEWGRK